MISLHTNLSSIITQQSMATSTNKLNTAIERMSTGYKINHAGDNAANYSIANNMSVQLSSCDVAADNIAMGMDLLSTAQDTIAGMQDRGSRIHALITQARNGTYGASSLAAMTQEAQALVSEINRLYMNTEYNGINLFKGNYELPDWAQEVKNTAGKIGGKSLEECAAEHNGFIAEVDMDTPDITVTDPEQLGSAMRSKNQKIGIGNAQTLAKFAELVNSGTTCEGKTIILTEDIDLSAYRDKGGWTPIGITYSTFQGDFNGNGHKITGLYINRPDIDYQGLFGYTIGDIKNICVEEAEVKGKNYTGGLAGYAEGAIKNSYATGSVTGSNYTGGLAGYAEGAIKNSYATGSVTGSNYTGGLAGWTTSTITNSYATGTVTGQGSTGGLAGRAQAITNSYATGTVTGNGQFTGGLTGQASGTITNSYATGSVTGTSWVGGLVGQYYRPSGTVTNNNILSSGEVTGEDKVGNLIGGIVNTTNGTSFYTINITNALACSGGDMIGFEGKSTGTAYTSGQMEGWLENITALAGSETTLQVGIHSGSDSQISVSTGLQINLTIDDLTSDSAYSSITSFLNQLSQKATELGAAQNRLESALESNLVQMDNLTSSLSTIRDADIAQVSSDYIRQQILQQAAATLMSTANQTPAIALQLL